ncbi:MAG: methyltransferase domain-containing protein [Alphaproteobacteria bacterium]|nr:methyltransferase domain-containing protein [Alphaproteobacteria bacterium]
MTEARFEFGKNWASYAEGVGAAQVDHATRCLENLVPRESLTGKSFLDLGCGSGLHSLAALRLGAARVTAIDYDPVAVETARRLLSLHGATGNGGATVRQGDILRLTPAAIGRHDIVYSWGVLHHTGDMFAAIARAAALTRPEGLLVLALYRRTPLCPAWRIEKRIYSASPAWLQDAILAAYMAAYRLRLALTGTDYAAFLADYVQARGMEFRHNARDWLGGYPYESIAPDRLRSLMAEMGFREVRTVVAPAHWGLFGSGCDEYVFRAPSEPAAVSA